ncbi:hypothetical protein AB0C10_08630 [Microbispora amethystogenes]|uniref:hypothetical protein n=1 Tax=Microbispora amethystogenes TaxID=1427754 RepID=UPI0034003900
MVRRLITIVVALTMLTQLGFAPGAEAATTRITLDFQLPERFDRAEMAEWASEFNNRNDLLSDSIQEEIAQSRTARPTRGSRRTTPGSRPSSATSATRANGVRLVSNGDLGLTAADMNDSLHPNNNGYRKMADAYHRAIKTAMADGTITPPLPGDSGECVPAPAEPKPPPTGPPPGTPTPDGWNWAGEIATGAAPRDQVRFANLNGDGRDDYLVIGEYGQIRAWLGNRGLPGSAWVSLGEVASGVSALRGQIDLAEINGDRRADYLVVDDQGGVRAWFNNGAGGPTVNPPMPADPDQGDGGMGTPTGGLPLCVANRCP